MATLNFPDSPDTGDTYYDSNAGFTYEWNGTVWISIEAGRRGNIQEIDDISGAFNGSTTAFILNVAANPIEPVNGQQVVISVGGVLQNFGDDYTIDGSTITFTTAPADGLTFFGTYLNPDLSVNTVADNTVSTGSLAASGNYTVGGINVTGVSTLSGLTYTGITSISNLSSSNLAVTGVGTIANVIHTKDSSGLGATIGAAVGVVTYYGDASNMTGIGMTLFPYTYSPANGATSQEVTTNINTTWNTSIEGGSGTITIRSGSASGTIVDQFVVGSSSSITIAGNSLTLNPAVTLANGTEYFVTYPAGSIKAIGGQHQNEQLITSFTTVEIPLLWAFGQNYFGSLGLNSEIAYSSPTQIPGTTWDKTTLDKTNKYGSASKSGAFKTDGTFWVWTFNNYGSLGLNQDNTDLYALSSPTQLSGTTWAHIALGDTLMTATKTDGTLWSWGDNRHGALGLNQAPPGTSRSSPTQVGTDTTWGTGACKLVAGAYAAGSIKTDGTLWVWGRNFRGSLGLNESGAPPSYPGSRSSPTQVPGTTWNTFSQSYSMSTHCHVIKTDGTLWSWGTNTNGRLGLNDVVNCSSPTQVGSGADWSHVSDKSWTIGIKTDGTMWSWGSNAYGALGLSQTGGPTTKLSSPTQIPGTTWSKSFSSSTHVAAIKTDGTIWGWGKEQNYGSLGQNNNTHYGYSSPVQVPGTWDSIFPLGSRSTGAFKP